MSVLADLRSRLAHHTCPGETCGDLLCLAAREIEREQLRAQKAEMAIGMALAHPECCEDVLRAYYAQPAQPPAPEIKRGKLVRASDKKSADWWRAVEAINRPHQFEAGDYRCKVCGTPWRCHPDGTWSIRTSRLAERCCDNHPGFLLVMEPDPSLPPPTPQPTDRSEAPSSEVSDLVLRIDAILGAEPGVLWARVVRPLLRDLRDELASAAASGSGAEEGQLIAERDELEEFVAACAAAAGCEREWSNLHDHRECVMEACRAFRAYVGAGKMESK